MTSQILTVTVHNPRVERVTRLTGDPDNLLMVTLGNAEYHGHVVLLVSDADWNSIGMAVSAFLDGEGDSDSVIGEFSFGYVPATDYSYEGGSSEQ